MTAAELPVNRASEFLGTRFDSITLDQVVAWVGARDRNSPFAYIVTPNVDHIVRLDRLGDGNDAHLAYTQADLSICDSQILRMLALLCGLHLPLVRGSDLADAVIERLAGPNKRIVLIGGKEDSATLLAKQLRGAELRQHRPPMGLLHNPEAMLAAAVFIEENPADIVFLAVGSPQQELIAHLARSRGGSTGSALCIGAGIDFVTGIKPRAPHWMRNVGLEWLHRLATDPVRLWKRYLIDDLRIFPITWRWLRRRK